MHTLRDLLPARRRQLNRALLRAVGEGQTEEARRLLDLGADPDAHDGSDTALGRAGRSPRADAAVMRLLLERGATVCPAEGSPLTPPLVRASHLSDEARIRLLLEHGADPNGQDRRGTGQTVLQGLATWADAGTLHLAIDRGADVNLRNVVNRSTALHTAAAAGHAEAVVVLLARGADVRAQDVRGRTPLACAEAMGASLPSGSGGSAKAYAEAIALLKEAELSAV